MNIDNKVCWVGRNTDSVKVVGFLELLQTLSNKRSELPSDMSDDTYTQKLIRGCVKVVDETVYDLKALGGVVKGRVSRV